MEDLVCVAVTTFMDRDTVPIVLERLAKTNYKSLKLYVIDYGSKGIAKFVDILQERYQVDMKLIKVKKDLGLSYRRNIALRYCLKERPKYIVLMDDDIVVKNVDWLLKLLSVMKNLPARIAVLQPIIGGTFLGGMLYENLTVHAFSSIPKDRSYWLALGGGGMFIARASYIAKLFKLGLNPFEEIFDIQSEDVDFAIKTIMLGHGIAITKVIEVDHIGKQSRVLYRTYHKFKNRILLAILNFRGLFVVKCMLFRIIHDFVFTFIVCPYSRKTLKILEPMLLAKAYLFILRNLKLIVSIRKYRRSFYVSDSDKRIEKYIIRMPLPLRWRQNS